MTRAFVVGVVFNVGANLIFMPTYGFRAAAIITIFSELSLLIAFYLTLRNALADAAPEGQREPVAWARILWRPALASALMAGAVIAVLPVGRLPALVVSGVNRGLNVGDDVTYSGTVAGALEGALLHVPSAAFSVEIDEDGRAEYETTVEFARKIAAEVLSRGLPPRANPGSRPARFGR